jgi:chemotaxis protein methyltransferase CheR
MTGFSSEQLASLAVLLKQRVGLHVRADGYSALNLAVTARLEQLEPSLTTPKAYLLLLRSEGGNEELRRLLPLVTVGKTSFFRDERQFSALAAILPGLLAQKRTKGLPISIWSAGCATGEEVYSIAMSAAEAGASQEELELVGTDVNPEAVTAAAQGRFEARRMHDVPKHLIRRYFDDEGGAHQVLPSLRSLVKEIRPHNLISSAYPLPTSGGWDIVFCRNVIIYFDTPTAQQVLLRFHSSLAPGGYLFLGYSESLFRLFEGFELVEVAGAFLYRRPEGAVQARAVPQYPRALATPPKARVTPLPTVAARVAAAPAPVITPPHAPAPVRHLHLAPPKGPEPAPTDELLAPQEVLDSAIELFVEGRFGAARDLLERLLLRGGEDLAVRLTLANLYGILRQPDRARQSYTAALALEPLSAEAHLFFAIHLLGVGELEEASTELARALFIDPDLSLAYYFLGRCREAQRDANRARMAYKNAIDAYHRLPGGKRQSFLGYYPDIPEDGSVFARAAEYALAAL